MHPDVCLRALNSHAHIPTRFISVRIALYECTKGIQFATLSDSTKGCQMPNFEPKNKKVCSSIFKQRRGEPSSGRPGSHSQSKETVSPQGLSDASVVFCVYCFRTQWVFLKQQVATDYNTVDIMPSDTS